MTLNRSSRCFASSLCEDCERLKRDGSGVLRRWNVVAMTQPFYASWQSSVDMRSSQLRQAYGKSGLHASSCDVDVVRLCTEHKNDPLTYRREGNVTWRAFPHRYNPHYVAISREMLCEIVRSCHRAQREQYGPTLRHRVESIHHQHSAQCHRSGHECRDFIKSFRILQNSH